MSEANDVTLDRDLRDLFSRGPRRAPAATLEAGLARAARVAQRRPLFELFDRRAWPPKPRSASDPAVHRVVRLAALAALVVLLAAVIAFGARVLDSPPSVTVEAAGTIEASIPGLQAGLWPDGRIVVVSEQRSGGYLFDVATGRTEAISFGSEFASTRLHVLPDGRVLLIGSPELSNPILPVNVGFYDIQTGEVDRMGQLPPSPPFGQATLILRDGRVLTSGGSVLPPDVEPCRPDVCGGPPTPTARPKVAGDLATVFLLDPVTWQETELAPLRQPRHLHSMAELDDGRILIVGGNRSVKGDEWVLEVETYDLATGKSDVVGSMTPSYRPGGAGLVPLGDGRILVFGEDTLEFPCGPPAAPKPSTPLGPDYHTVYRQKTAIFDPRTDTLDEGPLLPHGLFFDGIGLGDGRAAVFGGHVFTPGGCSDDTGEVQHWLGIVDPDRNVVDESYDPTAPTTLRLAIYREYVTGVLLADGRLALIASDDEHPRENQVDIFTIGP